MRVAYISNALPEFSTENDVRKAFEYLGHTVTMLQENMTPWQRIREVALSSDLLLITSTWDTAQPLIEMIETFRQCGMRGIPTATLHLDIFFGSDRGERNWKMNPMFFTSHVFTADGSHQKEWELLGINHHWLRPGVRHDAAHFGKYRPEYACDVAFVGSNGNGYHVNAWPYRKRLVDALREMCQRNGWNWRNPGGDHPKVDRGEDLNDFYASAKVTVGDSLCLDLEKSLYCSDRVYEATGRGGLLIMPRIDFVGDDFDNELSMYPWGDFAALESKIRYYLNHPDSNLTAREITQEIASQRHTYVNRVQEMLDVMGVAS